MSGPSRISWTNASWNPTTGCSKVSAGCLHCYAETMSLRHGWSKKPWTKANATENFILHPDRLRWPYSLKNPCRIFVDSMSDLFHELVPEEFLGRVFEVMDDLPQHIFQILTKRPERAADWSWPGGFASLPFDAAWPAQIWLGTSVENARVLHRIDDLRRSKAQTKFVSFEPLIGWIPNVNLSGIAWAIVGGESGPKFRPMDMRWARRLRDICVEQGVAFFFKQDASKRPETRRWLVEEDGTRWEWRQYPGDLAAPVQVVGRLAEREAV